MSKIYKLAPADEINDQACLWIARLDRGLSTDEQQALKKWVNESHAHASALYRAAELWDKMDDLSRLADLFEAPKETRFPYGIAASLIAGLVALGLFFSTAPFTTPQTDTLIANHQIGRAHV